MTFEKFVIKFCTDRMMVESQARQVLGAVKTAQPSMNGRWHEQVSDYPESVMFGVAITVKGEALDWIDKNLPSAFYRELFL